MFCIFPWQPEQWLALSQALFIECKNECLCRVNTHGPEKHNMLCTSSSELSLHPSHRAIVDGQKYGIMLQNAR